MRKYMIGVTCWTKQDQIGWLLDGIDEHDPGVAHVRFVFDACMDDSVATFDRLSCCFSRLECSKDVHDGPEQLDEIKSQNRLLKYFLGQTDCDAIVIMHHDQRLRAPMLPLLDKIIDKYGKKIGYIGGRAGANVPWSGVTGPLWGIGPSRKPLAPGAFAERPVMNSGPVTYPRSTVHKVGYLDEQFEHWFFFEDYGMRCWERNLTSVIMWTDFRHRSFGTAGHGLHYSDGSHKRDHARFDKKWPKARVVAK